MILGNGVDIIEISRIKKAMNQKGFMDKIFTYKELEYIKERNFKEETVAASFSGKEAVSKALGTGFRGFGFRDIEILRDELGKPYVVLYEGALKRAEELRYQSIKLSLSHDRERATAFAILEGGGSIKNMSTVGKCYSNRNTSDIQNKSLNKNRFEEEERYENFISSMIPVRKEDGHKGDYGRILIVAGSKGFTGAAYLSAEAALRSGGGLITLATRKEVMDVMAVKLNEAMTSAIEDEEEFIRLIEKSDTIAIGPGMGNDEFTFKAVSMVLNKAKCPVVIDADGINCLQNNLDLLKNSNCSIVITPHLGEMARITKLSIKYIEEHRREVAEEFARNYGIVVLLKGKNTIVTDGCKTFINPTGNSAMASGGMGDTLTGLISALIGQGLSALDGTVSGAYIHGKAGDILSENMYSLLARDIIEMIPCVMKELTLKNHQT